MNEELPTATVTVHFDQPVTGEQLAALVQQVANRNDSAGFVLERRYYDGDITSFGQESGYPYNHIRVVPSLEGLPFFRPNEPYTEVKVTSHSWGGSVYAVGYTQQSVINAVREFAAELNSAYHTALVDSFPEYVEPTYDDKPW